MLARRAGKVSRILEDALAVSVLRVILPLRVDVGEADLHRVQLVPADPPRDDLFFASPRVEPPPVGGLHHRDGKRPIVWPDAKRRLGVRLDKLVCSVVRLEESGPCVSIGDIVTRGHERAALAAEDTDERVLVPGTQRGHE